MAAVRRGRARDRGVVGVTGPVEDYLRQLRASLHAPPLETVRILAEAEDHLAESVAAGLAAGLSETEAAEAAISSFGSVRAVVRAHQTRRSRAVAALSRLAMTVWLVAGSALVSVCAISLVLLVVRVAAGPPPARDPGFDATPEQVAFLVSASGSAGFAVLACYVQARRRSRCAAELPVQRPE